MARKSFDDEFLGLIKEVSPELGYIIGFEDCAGKIFVPSETNLREARKKTVALKGRATNDLQKKSLAALLVAIDFDEPQPILDTIVTVIFSHLAKEGINEGHLVSLLKDAQLAVETTRKRFSGKKVPIGVKLLTLYRLDGLTTLLETLKSEVKGSEVKRECDRLAAKVKGFATGFEVEGFGHGEFPNVEKIIAREGFSLGREKTYAKILADAFDYDESPEELERMAIGWIDEELSNYRKATERLAKELGCEPKPEVVEAKINARVKLDAKKLVETTKAIRKVVQPLMNADVHGINPKYKTTVVETPSYLTGTIPSGAAMFFDTYTKKPFQYFFQTTDPKRDPDRSVPGLLNLLVHEEYGHCVHHSNSAMGFVGKIGAVQLMPGLTTGGPVTEGLSFNRELEFFEASKRLEGKARLSAPERAYVKALEKYGGLKLFNMELDFWTRRYRLVRFLRVVGDVRLNTGKQSIIDFVDWANKYTGVPRSSMFFQIFPAHEGFPGYATAYAVVGQEIRAMQLKLKDDRARRSFSTYLCSIGFPPRTIYRKMLLDYAKTLRR